EERNGAKMGFRGNGAEATGRAGVRSRRGPVELRPLTAEERQVIERLKRWRKRTAEQERIPAYLICHDRTLEHLAIVRPGTVEELANIFGLGAARIAKYGPELLNQLRGDAD